MTTSKSATTPERAKRADAVRNIEAIVDAATRLLAVEPDASVNEIAKAAGVGRITLYGHFDSRTALVREVVKRAIHNTSEVLATVDLEGTPRSAFGHFLEAAWRLTHRYGAVVLAGTQTLPPDEVQRAHDELATPALGLLRRGREAGEFRSDVPVEWQLSVAQAILHGASAAVYRGEVTADAAPALVRDTVLAAISAP